MSVRLAKARGIHADDGDLFASGCEALVAPVNCLGVHGKGLAREFARRFPGPCAAYTRECRLGRVVPGILTCEPTGGTSPQYVVFFPTKDDWRRPSEVEFVVEGLEELVELVRSVGIRSIAIPALGCGLGGLPWEVVRPMIEQAGRRMTGCSVVVYGPR